MNMFNQKSKIKYSNQIYFFFYLILIKFRFLKKTTIFYKNHQKIHFYKNIYIFTLREHFLIFLFFGGFSIFGGFLFF